ncbi:MAG: EscU/YscU/HrcU family type III secretion system export apparatus switch protein [Deltaproteobacteria bacterium]|nr:EscU/YscU/HrcU family type III secretion system export apparatus switch protein [Deltaproteobacteria bacterium]
MSSEKTEQPTEKRKREAREKGQVARSKALSATASGSAAMLAAFGTLSGSAGEAVHYTRAALEQATALGQSPDQAVHAAVSMLLALAIPTLATAVAAAALVTAAQVGLQLNLGHVAPKLERLDPSAAWKKMFGVQSVIEVLRSLVAVAVVGGIGWATLRNNAAMLANLASTPGDAAMCAGLGLALQIAKKAAFALLALGAIDYGIQRWQHLKSLMMTREEVKQEHKNSEGDPHIKGKRKRLAKELLNAAGKGVKGATAVVVNPTHVAVALLYDTKIAEAPVIVARGTEAEALQIRLEARRYGVPIVKDVPLARTLVNFQVGEEVPEELYQAVAGILKVVFEQQLTTTEHTP